MSAGIDQACCFIGCAVPNTDRMPQPQKACANCVTHFSNACNANLHAFPQLVSEFGLFQNIAHAQVLHLEVLFHAVV